MARVNHKRVRQLLNEKQSKITDKQFFTSRILAGSYEDMAAAQSKRYHYNRRVRVNICWDTKDPNGAMTNNRSITINAGNPFITKTRGRQNRYVLVSGLFAHELGHVLYTDFLAKQTYLNYLCHHKWYPEPPALHTTRDAANELAFWDYVKAEPRNGIDRYTPDKGWWLTPVEDVTHWAKLIKPPKKESTLDIDVMESVSKKAAEHEGE